MLDKFQPLIDWLHAYPHWAAVITFFIAFIESLALIGMIVPGSMLLIAIGTLIGSDILPLYTTILCAILGAIGGDGLSYWFGHTFRTRIRDWWPFRSYPNFLEKGETFFKNYGDISIFLGRFVGPTRGITPVVAGMLGFPVLRFFAVGIPSALVWAPVYIVPGILIGAASEVLEPGDITRLLFMSLVIIAAIWFIVLILEFCLSQLFNHMDRGLQILWSRIERTPIARPLVFLLHDTHTPTAHGQFTLLIMTLFSGFLLFALTLQIIHYGPYNQLNLLFYHLARSSRAVFLDPLAIGITNLGEKSVLLFPALVLAVDFFQRRLWRTGFYWLAALLGGILAASLLKHGVASPRPLGITAHLHGWSFPSGHVALSTTLYGFLTFLCARELTGTRKKLVILASTILCLLIAGSRIYLGAHWFTDVLGGLFLGCVIFLVLAVAYQRRPIKAFIPLHHTLVFIIALLLSWGIHSYLQLPYQLSAYHPVWPKKTISFTHWWNTFGTELPLLRHDRLGSPVQVLNLQWAGPLPTIKAFLQDHAWKQEPHLSPTTFMNRFSDKNEKNKLPLLPKVYDDRAPVLVFTKLTKTHVLVLRLWRSGVRLQDSTSSETMPLWMGAINSLTDERHPWFSHPHTNGPDILQLFESDIKKLPMQRRMTSCGIQLKHVVGIFSDHCATRLLLVLPKENN